MRNLTWIATTQTSQWQSKDAATTSLDREVNGTLKHNLRNRTIISYEPRVS